MEEIHRAVFDQLKRDRSKKALIILGSKSTGKTFLLKQFCADYANNYILLNGEDASTVKLLEPVAEVNYKKYLADTALLAIDNADKILNIGSVLKLLEEKLTDVKILLTCSSEFDLQHGLGVPLTSPQKTYRIHPLAQSEIKPYETPIKTHKNLSSRLIFGSYPGLMEFDTDEEKGAYLKKLLKEHLLKNIVGNDKLRRSYKMFSLLRLIAFETGKEVSVEDLGIKLGMSKNTVEKYLDLLTKVFVLYKVTGYTRNLRKEIVKMHRWYFTDNGIRNAAMADFSPFDLRNDKEALWENYVISERIKHQSYSDMELSNFFWRTYDQQKIDWIEEGSGSLMGYEIIFKYKNLRPPGAWTHYYPDAGFEIVSRKNYLDWIGA